MMALHLEQSGTSSEIDGLLDNRESHLVSRLLVLGSMSIASRFMEGLDGCEAEEGNTSEVFPHSLLQHMS